MSCTTESRIGYCRPALLALAAVLVSGANNPLVAADVFLTGAAAGPVAGIGSLSGFDGQTETFTTDAGLADSSFFGVTTLGQDVLVADFINERVQRFDRSGTLLAPFAAIENPVVIESDSSGNVFVGRGPLTSLNAVTRFDATGTVTGAFNAAELDRPEGVDADSSGNVYVADAFDEQLLVFAPNGTLLDTVDISPFTGGSVGDLAIDEAGNRLFAAVGVDNQIVTFDITGATPIFTGVITGPVGSDIVGIHFDPFTQHLFATDIGATNRSGTPRGFELDLSGNVLATFNLPSEVLLAFDIVAIEIPEPSAAVLVAVAFGALPSVARRRYCRS